MKTILKWTKILVLSLFLSAIIISAYVGPKGMLFLKADMLGPAFWDLSFLSRLEYGEEYQDIHDRSFSKPFIRWSIPVNWGDVRKIMICQVFDCTQPRISFYEKILGGRETFSKNSQIFFTELKKAKGLKFLIWETENGSPLVVWERQGRWLDQKWVNPIFEKELLRLIKERNFPLI